MSNDQPQEARHQSGDSTEWVIDYDNRETLDHMEHRNGVAWYDAPPPRKWWHKHQAQTRGMFDFKYVERCACGAFGPAPWVLLDEPRLKGKP